MSETPDIPLQRIVIGLQAAGRLTIPPGFADVVQGRNRVQLETYPVYKFLAADGTPILTIWPDGRAELGANVTLDEASAAFWRHVIATNPILARPCPNCGAPMELTYDNLCGI